MATGGSNQSQLGYEDCVWSTRRETVGPPGPQSTLNLSLAGAVDEEVSFRCRDLEETVPLVSNSGAEESLSLESQHSVDTARRQDTVTQSAVHSTSINTRPAVSFTHLRSSQPCLVPHDENVVRTARPPSLQLWRTGVAGQHVCNPSDPQITASYTRRYNDYRTYIGCC